MLTKSTSLLSRLESQDWLKNLRERRKTLLLSKKSYPKRPKRLTVGEMKKSKTKTEKLLSLLTPEQLKAFLKKD